MKRGWMVLLPGLLMVGCATDGGGSLGAGAPAGRDASVVTSSVSGSRLSGMDHGKLRKSRNVYADNLGKGGWEGETEYTGRLKVYRWGENAEVPIESYSWNADAGERWHVVRECCAGKPESCGRGAAAPIDEFYTVDAINLTLVTPSTGAPSSL